MEQTHLKQLNDKKWVEAFEIDFLRGSAKGLKLQNNSSNLTEIGATKRAFNWSPETKEDHELHREKQSKSGHLFFVQIWSVEA